MTSISITTVRACREKTSSSFLIPIVSRNTIEEHIDSFIRERTNLHRMFSNEDSSLVLRDLFQNCERELFFFPDEEGRQESYTPPAGELLLCPLSNSNNGITLYFFPNSERYSLRAISRDKRQKLKFFLRENASNKVEFFSFSRSYISCLALENGSIITNTNGSFTLEGIEIGIILSKNSSSTLTCKKLESSFTVPMRPIRVSTSDTIGYNNFVKVLCSSQVENFCCVLKFPVLTEEELQLKLSQIYAIRARNFQLLNIDQHLHTLEQPLFLSHFNELISFPRGMGINLLLRHVCGGSVFFSHDQDKHFKYVIISDLFTSQLKNVCHRNLIFPDWQARKGSFLQRNLSTSNMFIFTSQEMQLVKKENSNEHILTGGRLRLISTCRSGFWGCFLSKDQPFSSQSSTWDAQAGSSQSSLNIPYGTSSAPHSQSNVSQPSTLMTHPQAVPFQCSMNLFPASSRVQPHGKRSATSSIVQPHGKKRLVSFCGSMNLPYGPSSNSQRMAANPSEGPSGSMNPSYTQSFPSVSHPQPSSSLPSMWNFPADPSQSPMSMPSAQSTGSYGPFPSQTSASWWDPQADSSQGPIGMPSAQPTGSDGPFLSQTSASWWNPQAGPSQGPIGMSSAQPTGSYEPFPSQTSASWWDPQAGPFQGPIGMSSAQPTFSYESFPSQTSASWWDPQADPSQGPMGMPFIQPTAFYGPSSSSQHTSWMAANPQAAASWRTEEAMGISASEEMNLENFTPQELHLDELQDILRKEKNDDYSQSESD